MELKIALVLSALFQLVAFIITVSLIPKTKYYIAWISISVGFLLMALRRCIEVYYLFFDTTPTAITITSSWIAVVISISMLVASFYIRKIFELLNRIQQLRKQNEARLLTAVISTEERERKHFAKELHDGLGPVLSTLKMTFSTINKDEQVAIKNEMLSKIEVLIDNSIAITKEISNNLTPHVLERYGLQKAIDNFIRNLPTHEKISIKHSVQLVSKRLKRDVEIILYRILCEMVNNTLKYAQASSISILITEHRETIDLIYDDNGIGFDIRLAKQKGMGITNIISRVTSLNGTIDMQSNINRGFYAHIKLPLCHR
ncbi:MAG: histidine kinase [Tenuifilaceae bacterium]|jgi:signal transduction histidine kinase|nr:histidine kinase [Tenuifilaceae bacterium]